MTRMSGAQLHLSLRYVEVDVFLDRHVPDGLREVEDGGLHLFRILDACLQGQVTHRVAGVKVLRRARCHLNQAVEVSEDECGSATGH